MNVLAFSAAGLDFTASAIVLGLINGMVYGLLSVGLVLVYRATRVVNFAHGQIGAFAAAAMALFVFQWGLPYWVAFVLALATGAAVGALVEAVAVRRLRRAPMVMSVVATIGVGQFLLSAGSAISDTGLLGNRFPAPPGFPEFTVGALTVSEASTAILVLSPIVVGALALFFARSRYGIAIRGSAANPEAAELAGIRPARMAGLAWGLAGLLSAMTAVLVLPTRSFTAAAAFGPSLLLLALVGAVIGRLTSLPWALAGGVFVGLLESILQWNYPRGSPVDIVLFVVLVVALLFQRREVGREREGGGYDAVLPWSPLPDAIRRLTLVRALPLIVTAIGAVAAVALPAALSNSNAVTATAVVIFALLGLSIVLLGSGGQLSLGQFGIAALGGAASYWVSHWTSNFALSFAAAGATAAVVSVVVGVPALRIRGLMLTVATLAFAQAALTWVLSQKWALGEGVSPGRPGFGSYYFDSSKQYYYFALIIFAIGFVVAWNYRRSGLGRELVGVRDNEDAARSFTVRATRAKVVAFALAGFLSGLAGALYIHSLTFVTANSFPLQSSVDVVALAAVGGIGLLGGPLLGALYIIALPLVIQLDAATLAATSLGWVVLVIAFPGGLVQVLAPLRNRAIDAIARLHGLDPAALRHQRGAGGDVQTSELRGPGLPAVPARASSPLASAQTLLEARGLTKRFGALTAVNDVSLTIREGEILGLIGPNGAGKSTLFEVLSGFTRPDTGDITFAGRSITNLSPEARGRLGLIRSFQDSALFPTLTVLETLELAQTRVAPTRFVPALIGLGGQDRRKTHRARELASLLGLESYASHQILGLSTGTRRIVELACLIALEPKLLLLDEPSSGIAQRETEALGEVLLRLKHHLDVTLVLIEHDMPLVMSLSHRMIAMTAGSVIAQGTPDEVRSSPAVITSYLGGNPDELVEDIVEGDAASAPLHTSNGHCRAITRNGTVCTRRARDDGLCGIHQPTEALDVR
jgi:ABC-type branched-subunit amino acid transport system ATPase component/ABC-type branched-subunit amino acid transport system permease subunit